MSVQTGIGPTELLSLDAEMFEAVVTATDEHWPLQLELAATSLEVAHAHLLAFVAVHSEKGTKLPDPLTVERPGRDKAAGPERISVGELAALPGLTAELREART